jgi:hypothetical protein
MDDKTKNLYSIYVGKQTSWKAAIYETNKKIILKRILEKELVRMWVRLKWLSVVSSGGLFSISGVQLYGIPLPESIGS